MTGAVAVPSFDFIAADNKSQGEPGYWGFFQQEETRRTKRLPATSLRVGSGSSLFRREHEEVLMRQERVFFAQFKPIGVHLLDEILAGDFHLHGRAERQFFFMKVDHDDLAAGFEHLLHRRKILGLVLDVVPDVADEKAIDRSIRQQWVVGIGEDRDDIRGLRLADAPGDVAHHVGAHIDGVDFAFVADVM